MRRLLAIIFLTSCFIFHVQATPQIPDILISGRDTMYMLSYPLKNIIIDGACDFPEFGIRHTGCARGYQATWQIVRGKLYLIQLRISEQGDGLADLGEIFGKKFRKGRVFASWVTEDMYAVYGKEVYCDHNIGLVHERERFISVKGGKISETLDYPSHIHDEGRLPRVGLEEYMDQIASVIRDNIVWGNLYGDSIASVAFTSIITKGGGLDIKIIQDDTHEYYGRQIIDILSPLKWDELIHRGKPLAYRMTIKLSIDENTRSADHRRRSIPGK